MKKIAIYIDTEFQGTGVSQYIKSLLNALINLPLERHALTIIYTSKCWENYLNNISNTTIIYLKKTNFLNRFYQLLISFGCLGMAKIIAHQFDQKVKFIDNKNFEFIIFPSGDAIACLIKSNAIGTIHDLMHRYEKHFKESGSFFRYHYRENYYKNLLISNIAVLVDSKLGKKQVIDSYKQINSEIFILPYIAPDYIYASKLQERSQSNNSCSNHRYLFYPAAFWPHKNHLNLLKAIKILKERGHLIHLYLGGKKQIEYKTIQKYVEENNLNNQVKFLGYISDKDMIDLYKNAYALIMPTFYGPTNIPPIEAILLNCVPMLSNNYAMQEQFEDAALYFDPKSIKQIADTIESLITVSGQRNNLIENGARIKDKFSQKRFETDLFNILKTLNVKN
jgi:glycosyltransferase involved in cell wall biosynthesis